MMYNPDKQYRCTIIRGRAKNEMDDLLIAYATILENITSTTKDKFVVLFNKELAKVLPGSTKKTLDNHRTEIVGKLFGMFYVDCNEVVQISPRTLKLLQDRDQPAFFKDMCYRLQLPNGMDRMQKVRANLDNKISIRQCAYILETLREADDTKIILTIDEIAYYVLNSLEVLQGSVRPREVVKEIIKRRDAKIYKRVAPGSRGMQHIRETLNYLELANLVRIVEGNIFLNKMEKSAIDFMASSWYKPLDFDVSKYEINTSNGRKEMESDWQKHYSSLASKEEIFNTSIESLIPDIEKLKSDGYDISEGIDTTALGNEGEQYVYTHEKKRVASKSERLARKVLHLGKTRGLGFDIQSVRADDSSNAEHAIYLEVKSTKRFTAPKIGGTGWSDVIKLTRNEWIAADQHRGAYSIYRVYFTASGVLMFAINDPVTLSENDVIMAEPETYRIEFDANAGDFIE